MLKLKSVNFAQQQFHTYSLSQKHSEQLEWTIGRNPDCDLILTSPEVSRVHGRIVFSNNAYHFVDVGSTFGSLFNGEVVPPNENRLMHVGDLLQIGEIILYVEEVTPLSPSNLDAIANLSNLLQLPEKQWLEGDLPCRCSRIIDETPDVKTFCFVADPPVLFHYKPGQLVNLEVEINGKPVIRSYSISSSPTRPYHLSLTIKRVPAPSHQPDLPAGLVSNWMHDHFKVGDRINFMGAPLGHFTCLPNLPAKMLLISAGSGITPMMSMSRWVQDTLTDCDVVFLHSARTPDDIVFRTELETMAAQMPNFRLIVTLTKPPSGRPWMGLTGRISEVMLNAVIPDFRERSVFVCGPGEFMQSAKAMLQALNFPMQNYQEESFGGRKPPATQSKAAAPPQPPVTASSNGKGHAPQIAPLPTISSVATASPSVNFAKTGQEVAADGTTSILELAEQEGISIRNACRVGACGACKVLTRRGQVEYQTPPAALTPTDQKAGYVLACVAYPVDQVVVEA